MFHGGRDPVGDPLGGTVAEPSVPTLVLYSSRYPVSVPANIGKTMTWEQALGGKDASFVEYDRFIAFPVSLAPEVTHGREAGWRRHTWDALAAAVRRGASALLFVPAGEGWESSDPLVDVLAQTNGLMEAIGAAGPRTDRHPLLPKRTSRAPLVMADDGDRWRAHLDVHVPDRELWGCDARDAARVVRPIAYLGSSRYRPVAVSIRIERGLVVVLPLRIRPRVDIAKLLAALDDEVRAAPAAAVPSTVKSDADDPADDREVAHPRATRIVQYEGAQPGDLVLVQERRRLWWQYAPISGANTRTTRWFRIDTCKGVLASLLVRAAAGESLAPAEIQASFKNALGKLPQKGTYTGTKSLVLKDLRDVCADSTLDPIDSLDVGTRVRWLASGAPGVRRVLRVEVEPGNKHGVVKSEGRTAAPSRA